MTFSNSKQDVKDKYEKNQRNIFLMAVQVLEYILCKGNVSWRLVITLSWS